MTWILVLGCLLTLAGLGGLVVCMTRAAALRKSGDKDALRAGLQGLVALNMASVGLAGLGLAVVVVGLIL